MGKKPPDNRCVPMFWEEHHHQHQISEKRYWGEYLDRAKWLAGLLWDHSGDYDKCCELIARFRHDFQNNQ
jgi:hypothetical protein